MWLGLYLAPKRHKLKQNRLDFQPLFSKEACATRPDSREGRNQAKMEIRAFLQLLL